MNSRSRKNSSFCERQPRKSERVNPYYRPQSRSNPFSEPRSVDSRRQRETDSFVETVDCPTNQSYSRGHKYCSSRVRNQSPYRSSRSSSRYTDDLLGPRRSPLRGMSRDVRQRSGQGQDPVDQEQRRTIHQTDAGENLFQPAAEADVSQSWYDMVEEENRREENLKLERAGEDENGCDGECLSPRPGSSRSHHCSEGSVCSTSDSAKQRTPTPRYTKAELKTEEVQLVLARRKKQIDYGKTQECYKRYLQLVPRIRRTKFHPQTPDRYRKYSRRGFDMLIRIWKKNLHAWEPADAKSGMNSNRLDSTCDDEDMTASYTEGEGNGGIWQVDLERGVDIPPAEDDFDSEFPPLCDEGLVKTETASGSISTEPTVVIKTEPADDFFPLLNHSSTVAAAATAAVAADSSDSVVTLKGFIETEDFSLPTGSFSAQTGSLAAGNKREVIIKTERLDD